MPDGWTTSNRKSELPANWEQLRKQVLDACGHVCEWRERTIVHGQTKWIRCTVRATDVDHIDDPANHQRLQGLCAYHHSVKTGAESARARRAQAQKLQHPREGNPGLL